MTTLLLFQVLHLAVATRFVAPVACPLILGRVRGLVDHSYFSGIVGLVIGASLASPIFNGLAGLISGLIGLVRSPVGSTTSFLCPEISAMKMFQLATHG